MARCWISWVSDWGRVTCLTSLGNRTGCCHVEGSVQILQSKTNTLGGRAYIIEHANSLSTGVYFVQMKFLVSKPTLQNVKQTVPLLITFTTHDCLRVTY